METLFKEKVEIANRFNPEKRIALCLGDTFRFLKDIPNNAISLAITSPPYNIGKEYEKRIRNPRILVSTGTRYR